MDKVWGQSHYDNLMVRRSDFVAQESWYKYIRGFRKRSYP